jgi:lipopolysaccharide transport system permease protein
LGFLADIRRFAATLWRRRGAIFELSRRDFAAQYQSTYLGMVWGFVHPLAFVLVLWVVFAVGLRSNPGKDVPFVVYLITGMISWHFFTGALASLTGVVKTHSFLVKKGDFNLALLHIAKLLSSLVPHLALIAVSVVVCWAHGLAPTFYLLQLFYYLAAMLLLLLGLGWITSSTSVFIEDVANVVTILIQFGFWLTPIIWNLSLVPARYRWLVKLNPAAYIVGGYRDSLVYHQPFWAKPLDAAIFWTITAATLLAGAMIFRRLKPHFGEVL